jgi:hypothetical protein
MARKLNSNFFIISESVKPAASRPARLHGLIRKHDLLLPYNAGHAGLLPRLLATPEGLGETECLISPSVLLIRRAAQFGRSIRKYLFCPEINGLRVQKTDNR